MTNKDTFAKDVKTAVEVLKKGGVILYPTDTIWGLGCDATNSKAIKRLYKIKERTSSKSMIVLVEDEIRLRNHVGYVPETMYDLLESLNKPLSVIYPRAKNLTKEAIAEDGSIAIRITSHPFCKAMIKLLNKPIISTSANISGAKAPNTFQEISNKLKEKVDYIIPTCYESINEIKASTLIQMNSDGTFNILRD